MSSLLNPKFAKRNKAALKYNRLLTPFFFLALLQVTGGAEVITVLEGQTQTVFGGGKRAVAVQLHNTGDSQVTIQPHVRLYQTTSATAVFLSEIFWKDIPVLPGQTVLEHADIAFPNTKAPTRFLIRWINGTNIVMGTTKILVYPTNLLADLRRFATSAEPIGLLDCKGHLKSALLDARIPLSVLEKGALKDFKGKLAIIHSAGEPADEQNVIAEQIEIVLKKGVAIVWIKPFLEMSDCLQPSFYAVPNGNIALLVANPKVVENFPIDPKSQFNLVELCRSALHPNAFSLKNTDP